MSSPPLVEVELTETVLKILTWNVWWRFGPFEQRRPAIEATLRRLGADVVGLQEAWDSDDGGGLVHELGEMLGYEVAYGEGLRVDGHGYGNAILSRWPIVDTDVVSLPATSTTNELRTVLRAEIDGPRGRFDVYTTHLNWKAEQSDIRQMQVRTVAEMVARSPLGPPLDRDVPPILVGDLNAVPDADEIRMLTGRSAVPVEGLAFYDAFEIAGEGPGLTWDSTNPFTVLELEPDRRIDYVLVGAELGEGGRGFPVVARVEGTDAVDGVVGSDHWAVYAELRY